MLPTNNIQLDAEPTFLSQPASKPEGLIGTPVNQVTGNGQLNPTHSYTFDAAIPGESLTKEPGNQPWERPPQFVNPSDAVEFIWKQISKPANMYSALTMMKQGVPVEAIAKVILFTGFSEGKWTPDVAMLIAKPVVAIIAGIAKAADVKTKLMMKDRSPSKVIEKMLGQQALTRAFQPDQTKPQEVTTTQDMGKSLMSRRSK
jgi:hypothetical protein